MRDRIPAFKFMRDSMIYAGQLRFLSLSFNFSAPQAKKNNVFCSKNEIFFAFERFESIFYAALAQILQKYAGQRYAGQDPSLRIYAGHPACPAYFMRDKETMSTHIFCSKHGFLQEYLTEFRSSRREEI